VIIFLPCELDGVDYGVSRRLTLAPGGSGVLPEAPE
jgi:hypothetical protein